MTPPSKLMSLPVYQAIVAARQLARQLGSVAVLASSAAAAFAAAARSSDAAERLTPLARAGLGLPESRSLEPQDWLSFDIVCGGRLGLIHQASLERQLAEEAGARLTQERSALDTPRAEAALQFALAQERQALEALERAEAQLAPYALIFQSPPAGENPIDSLRRAYERHASQPRAARLAALFLSPALAAGERALRRARSLGADPFALAQARESARSGLERAQTERQAAEAAKAETLRKEAERQNDLLAQGRFALWSNGGGPSALFHAALAERSSEWDSAFEALARARPHLAPLAASAAGAALSRQALARAAGRLELEAEALLCAQQKARALASEISRRLKRGGPGFQARLGFDLAAASERVESDISRLYALREQGPAELAARCRSFGPIAAPEGASSWRDLFWARLRSDPIASRCLGRANEEPKPWESPEFGALYSLDA